MNIKTLSGGHGGRGQGFGGFFSGGILTQKVNIDHTMFQTAGLSNSITLWPIPAGALCLGSRLKCGSAWLGGAITNYFLSLGVAGATQDLMTEYDAMNIVVSDTEYAEAFAFQSFNYNAAVNLVVTARSVGGNLSLSTQGVGVVEVFYLPKV